jgi:mRNA interferase RelE/StbE
MSLFEIDLKGSVERDLKRIDRQYISKLLDAIESLAKNPFPVQSKKLKDSESCYRLRIGDYRVIYHARHRKDAYK